MVKRKGVFGLKKGAIRRLITNVQIMTTYIQQGIVLTFHGDRKDIELSIAWGKRSGDQMQVKITRVALLPTDDKEVTLSLYVDIFETKRFDFDAWWNTAIEVLQNDEVKGNANN